MKDRDVTKNEKGERGYHGLLSDEEFMAYRRVQTEAWNIVARALGWEDNNAVLEAGYQITLSLSGYVLLKGM